MSAPARKEVLARNTLYASLGYAVGFVLPVLMTPYILHKIGRGEFGVLAALSTAGLWLGRYDLGIWAALPREVADRQARGDRPGLAALATTWLTVDLLVGAVLMGAVVAGGRGLLPWLLPAATVNPLRPVLVAIALQSVLGPVHRHLTGSLGGLQRLDLAHKVGLLASPLQLAGLVTFLERGWGLLGIALNGAIFSILQIVALAVVLVRAGYPWVPNPAEFRWGDLARLVGFGWKLEANQLLLQGFRSDRLLLSATGLPAALIGFYQIGSNVADRLAAAIMTLSSAVFPAVSDLAARDERDRIRALLMRGTKVHALGAVGLIGFAALFGPEILVLWMGQPLPEAVVVLRLMAAGAASVAIVSCAQAVAAGLGRADLPLRSTAIGLLGAVLLYTTAGRRYDYGGLAGSVSAGMVLSQAAFMIGFHGMLEFRWREWVGNALLKPLAALAPLIAVYGVWRLAGPHLPPVEGRGQALLILVPAFLFWGGAAWLAARSFRVLDEVDVDVLKSLSRRTPA